MPPEPASDLPPWKAEFDAIVGARHGGQVSAIATRLADLDQRHPNVAEIAFQLGWTYDVLGRSAEAVRHYEKAIALGLPPNDLSAAMVGLGNALRVIGEPARAVELLESTKRQFPDYREIDLYLALALHDAGRPAEAIKGLIEAVLETTEDPGILAHQRALRFHLAKLQVRPL